VRVIPAVSQIEAGQSQALLGNTDVGYFMLFEGGDHLASARALLESIATSTTVFQPYASVLLGLSAARDFNFASRGTVRKADPDRARRYLASPPGPVVSPYYLLARKRTLESLALSSGDRAEADRYRNEISAELGLGTRSSVARQALQQFFAR
jgi:hypothetical protein